MDRRNRLDLNHPAELAIYNAMQEVEKMPPSVKLTEAVIKLQEARNLVADFVDDPPINWSWRPPTGLTGDFDNGLWEARDKRATHSDEWIAVKSYEAEYHPLEDYEYRKKMPIPPTDKQDKP